MIIWDDKRKKDIGQLSFRHDVKVPHEAIHANRFISQLLDFGPGNAKSLQFQQVTCTFSPLRGLSGSHFGTNP